MQKLFSAKNIKQFFSILLGLTIYTFGLVAFVLPTGIIAGGTTGMGLVIEHFFGVPISLFVLLFNVSMLVLGYFTLGLQLVLTTIVSSVYFPFALQIMKGIPALQNLTSDPMLGMICGGLCIGVGIGIVIHAGASTGGVEILCLTANKKWGVSVSIGLYVVDFCILLMQTFYATTEQIIYGILLVLVYTVVLDKVLLMGSSRIQVQIVSDHVDVLNEYVLHTMDRGTTFLYGKTGYLKKEQSILLTVISTRELVRLKQTVNEIDPNAFMIINNVSEVRGRGFSKKRKHVKEDTL